MSFFSNAVRLIRRKEVKDSQSSEKVANNSEYTELNGSLQLDFSLRNYAKESFSVLIVRPLSLYVQKILRTCAFLISGILVGGLVALISCLIALQFGSVENTVISAFLLNKIEKMLPDYDLSIKSAMLHWNSETSSVEINLNKIRFDDFFIPRVSILPDYAESFKQQRFIAKTISIVRPKISLDIADDFQTISVSPNFAKGGKNKAYFEPISSVMSVKDSLIGTNSNAVIKLVNADVSILENGVRWDLQNLYCEHKLGENVPSIIDFRAVLPKQSYSSAVRMVKSADNLNYDVKINSLNPSVIYDSFVKRKTAIEKFLPLIQGYNLPVSGDIKVALNPDYSLKKGVFNLVTSSGSIRLPNRNTLSLNLGKRIDNGSISGRIYSDKMLIDFINVSYGNSGVQLTGLSVPLSDFNFLDVANVDGTLSLTSVNTKEMYTILPHNISKSIIPIFQNYLPGFRLDLLKFDLKGAITFGDRLNDEKLSISQGIFKIHDAKISIGEHVATNVDATGSIKSDGVDVKVTNALFGKAKINSGVFFISNQDNSWIGRVNTDVAVEDISTYAPGISDKFASFPIGKLGIKGLAKVDLKVVRVAGNELGENVPPFIMVEGDGAISSEDNTKQFKISWDEKGLSAVGDIESGKIGTHFKIEEDFIKNTGTSEFKFKGESAFFTEFFPFIADKMRGNFDMTITNSWNDRGEDFDIYADLNNANMFLPVIGSVKLNNEQGTFSTHVHKYPDRIVLSQMYLDTPKTKFKGQVTTDNNWNVTECVIENVVSDGIAADISVLKKNDKKTIISLVGDIFDASKLINMIERADKNTWLVTYLNLKELTINGNSKIKNVKGTVDILGGKIVKGACIGVIGESTVALNTSDVKDGGDYLLSISASNAGDFLKAIGIGDTISGGSLNLVMKSSKLSDGSMSGAFEMDNFLIKNSPQLTKLISLSSPNYLMGTDLIVGFNNCTGSIIVVNGKIKLDNCKAVGPTVAISLGGEYDRINDNWNIAGILLPTSSANNRNVSELLAANFNITGSYWNPSLSVNTPKFVPSSTLSDLFGDMVPLLNNDYNYIRREDSDLIAPPATDVIKDPYAQEAFDRVAVPASSSPVPTNKKKKVRNVKRLDQKFGVTIKRGLKSV